jgi:hypothetical protein
MLYLLGSRYSVSGITTRCGMPGLGFESREEREIISSPNTVQSGYGAHTYYYSMGTGFFPGGKKAEACS